MSMTDLRSDWLIGYYALGRDKFSAKTISIILVVITDYESAFDAV